MGGGKGEKIVRGSPMVLADAIYPLPHLPSRCPMTSHIAFCTSRRPYLQTSRPPAVHSRTRI